MDRALGSSAAAEAPPLVPRGDKYCRLAIRQVLHGLKQGCHRLAALFPALGRLQEHAQLQRRGAGEHGKGRQSRGLLSCHGIHGLGELPNPRQRCMVRVGEPGLHLALTLVGRERQQGLPCQDLGHDERGLVGGRPVQDGRLHGRQGQVSCYRLDRNARSRALRHSAVLARQRWLHRDGNRQPDRLGNRNSHGSALFLVVHRERRMEELRAYKQQIIAQEKAGTRNDAMRRRFNARLRELRKNRFHRLSAGGYAVLEPLWTEDAVPHVDTTTFEEGTTIYLAIPNEQSHLPQTLMGTMGTECQDTGKTGIYFSDNELIPLGIILERQEVMKLVAYKLSRPLTCYNGKYSFRTLDRTRMYASREDAEQDNFIKSIVKWKMITRASDEIVWQEEEVTIPRPQYNYNHVDEATVPQTPLFSMIAKLGQDIFIGEENLNESLLTLKSDETVDVTEANTRLSNEVAKHQASFILPPGTTLYHTRNPFMAKVIAVDEKDDSIKVEYTGINVYGMPDVNMQDVNMQDVNMPGKMTEVLTKAEQWRIEPALDTASDTYQVGQDLYVGRRAEDVLKSFELSEYIYFGIEAGQRNAESISTYYALENADKQRGLLYNVGHMYVFETTSPLIFNYKPAANPTEPCGGMPRPPQAQATMGLQFEIVTETERRRLGLEICIDKEFIKQHVKVKEEGGHKSIDLPHIRQEVVAQLQQQPTADDQADLEKGLRRPLWKHEKAVLTHG